MINGISSVLSQASDYANNAIRDLLPANASIVAACNMLHNATNEKDITKINADDLNNIKKELQNAFDLIKNAIWKAGKSKADIDIATSIMESELIVKRYENENELKKKEKEEK